MTQWHLLGGVGGSDTNSKGEKEKCGRAAFFNILFECFRGISHRHVCTASGFHQHTGIIYTEGFTNHNETSAAVTTLRPTDGTSTELTTARRTHNRPIFSYKELWEVSSFNRTYSKNVTVMSTVNSTVLYSAQRGVTVSKF